MTSHFLPLALCLCLCKILICGSVAITFLLRRYFEERVTLHVGEHTGIYTVGLYTLDPLTRNGDLSLSRLFHSEIHLYLICLTGVKLKMSVLTLDHKAPIQFPVLLLILISNTPNSSIV